MTEGVVDLLQPVDVDEDAVHRVALPASLLDHLRADHGQPAPVRHAGQVVAYRGRLGRRPTAEVAHARPAQVVDDERETVALTRPTT